MCQWVWVSNLNLKKVTFRKVSAEQNENPNLHTFLDTYEIKILSLSQFILVMSF